MKVQLKNVHPNPFRDIQNYPINRAKVESLKQKINHTSFWENLIGRRVKSNGKMQTQIAYGHHRLLALQELYGDKYEFDLRIRPFTDTQMIQIMAAENDDDWKMNPLVVMETVKVAKLWLEANRDEFTVVVKNHSKLPENIKARMLKPDYDIGGRAVAEFLAWPESRCKEALKNLRATGELPEKEAKGDGKEPSKRQEIAKKVLDKMPTLDHATRFVREVERHRLSPKGQQRVANKIASSKESIGSRDIKKEVLKERVRELDAKSNDKDLKRKQRNFEDFLKECRRDADKFERKVQILLDYKEAFDSQYYKQTFEAFDFKFSATKLMVSLAKLFGDNQAKKVKALLPAKSKS